MNQNENQQTAGAADPGGQVPADVSAAAAALGRRGKGRPKRVTPERKAQLQELASKMTAKRRAVAQGRAVSVGTAGSAAVVRATPRVVQAGRVVATGRRIVAPNAGEVRRFG